VRRLGPLVVASIARVEVPAAVWRKERLGELHAADAEVLVAAFEADWFGTEGEPPRFASVGLAQALLDRAAGLVATHALRTYDAIQLASALAARDADPDCRELACFDEGLRGAAAREGFSLVPGAS
jgi:predicted nucleic acid-binding protein